VSRIIKKYFVDEITLQFVLLQNIQSSVCEDIMHFDKA
jgi:hypothetical protein